MNYQFTRAIELGRKFALLTEYLPHSSFPRKVARVEIKRDGFASNPRTTMSPMWHFVNWERNYSFDWYDDPNHFDDEDLDRHFRNEHEAVGYIESFGLGFRIQIGHNCEGELRSGYEGGYAFITWDEIRNEYSGMSDEEALVKALAALQGEIETYNAWVTGDTWGYIAYDENGEKMDDCWGYYGESGIEYIKQASGASPDTIVEIEE